MYVYVSVERLTGKAQAHDSGPSRVFSGDRHTHTHTRLIRAPHAHSCYVPHSHHIHACVTQHWMHVIFDNKEGESVSSCNITLLVVFIQKQVWYRIQNKTEQHEPQSKRNQSILNWQLSTLQLLQTYLAQLSSMAE